jgi:hypothetical protein
MKIAVLSSEGTSEISQPQSGWCPAKNIFQVPQERRTFSTVPSGRNWLRTVFQPLRSWLISGCRSATQFALAVMVLFFALGATAQTTNALSDKEIQGRQLAQKLLEMQPTDNFTNTGVLQIRSSNGKWTNFPIECEVIITPTNWSSVYDVLHTNDETPGETMLTITHSLGEANKYFERNLWGNSEFEHNARQHELKTDPTERHKAVTFGFISNNDNELKRSFVGSDFCLGDLGLEFLHWPEQKILRGDTARGRLCKVLESTNPYRLPNGQFFPGGYSRVLSWVDNETLGIVEAEAYDAKGKKLKEFYPNDFKKVNGQWQVGSMEIDNVQTRSRTTLKFDLKK